MAVRSSSLWLSSGKAQKRKGLLTRAHRGAGRNSPYDFRPVHGRLAGRGWFRSPAVSGSIATRLNDMHIPSPSGSQWARITIRGIIKNPTYIGMVRWGSRETKKKVVDARSFLCVVLPTQRKSACSKAFILRSFRRKHLSSQTISSPEARTLPRTKKRLFGILWPVCSSAPSAAGR